MHEFKDYNQFLTFLTAQGKSEMDINFPDFGRAEVSQLGAKNKNSQLVYTFSEFTPYNHEAIIDSFDFTKPYAIYIDDDLNVHEFKYYSKDGQEHSVYGKNGFQIFMYYFGSYGAKTGNLSNLNTKGANVAEVTNLTGKPRN